MNQIFCQTRERQQILTYVTFISAAKLNAASTMPNFQPEAAKFPVPSR